MYVQPDGLAMGSPLAGILAEVFINALETTFFNSSSELRHKIRYYARYVDDIFIAFDGTDHELEHLFNIFNGLHEKISFTKELQNDKRELNFLDLTISIEDNSFHFNIFRKETYSDNVIPSDSTHPKAHKLAFFHSAIHRMVTTPLSPADQKKELNVIKAIAVNNGYNQNMIDHLLNKKISQKCSTLRNILPTDTTETKKFISIPFLGNLSYRIKRLLNKKYNCNVSFSTDNSLKRNLVQSVEIASDWFSNSGVYKLTCNNCPSYYIGQTGRAVKTRYKEHLLGKKGTNIRNSTFAEHLLITGHTPKQLEDTVILHRQVKGRRLDLWEELFIFKHLELKDGNILNDQLNLACKQFFEGFKPVLFNI
ncbi:uncharacterized protein LOC126427904 isoform X2 [Schistocerca serialis cubense]|nr:uncharacterized protein LOC126427904 isoform X2 [Schistocerca serialis cubense]